MQTCSISPPDDDPLFEKGVQIVRRLDQEGYTAFFAGGCVRDRLMDRSPEDYDVATDASPGVVESLFSHTIAVGKAFGVMIVVLDGDEFDVARFRTEGDYEDGRRPDHVEFASPQEDVKRRDFTVNGLLWDPLDDRVIDYVNGLWDLDASCIRTIGPPSERFSEDYLRMLRAPRFAAQLDFDLHSETARAIRNHAEQITDIARERVLDELKKLMLTSYPGRGVNQLDQLCLLEHLLPEVHELAKVSLEHDERDETVLDHTVRTLSCWARNRRSMDRPEPKDERIKVGFSLLLHDIAPGASSSHDGKGPCESSLRNTGKQARAMLRRLRASNELTRTVCSVLDRYPHVLRADEHELADWKQWIASDHWLITKRVCRSILDACSQLDPTPFQNVVDLENATDPEEIDPERLLTGEDLINMGLEPGPQFGRLLENVRRAQLNEQISTAREARERVRSLLEDR